MIQPKGYFKIHRELYSKPIWCNSTSEQRVVLMTLLAMANWKENQWDWNGKRFDVQPGQFVTSLESIVKECGCNITVRNVRTALNRFENLGFLTSETTNRGRLITLRNWAMYQANDDEPTSKVTGARQAPDKRLTTNEEGKKNKKVIKDIYSAKSLQEIASKFPGKKIKKVRDQKLPKLLEMYSAEQIRGCLERYAAECQGKDKRYILNESTFWNGRYMDYMDQYYEEPSKVQRTGPGTTEVVESPQAARARKQAEQVRARLKIAHAKETESHEDV